jgi:hypothetical protein
MIVVRDPDRCLGGRDAADIFGRLGANAPGAYSVRLLSLHGNSDSWDMTRHRRAAVAERRRPRV